MGILQAIPEWVAMPSSREFSQPRDETQVSNPGLLHCRQILHSLSALWTLYSPFFLSNFLVSLLLAPVVLHCLGEITTLARIAFNSLGG